MPEPINKILLLSAFTFLSCTKIIAQTDSTEYVLGYIFTCEARWQECVNKGSWDSAISYGNMMEVASKNCYGEINFLHALVLGYHIGHTYAVMGNNTKAYNYLKHGIEIFDALNDTGRIHKFQGFYNEIIFDFGIVCTAVGSNSEAEMYLAKAADLFGGTGVNYIQCILNLASLCTIKGEYAKSGLLHIKALEILDTIPKDPDAIYLRASVYNNLGELYSQTGNTDKALEYMKKANDDGREIEGAPRNQNTEMLLNLAMAYAFTGNLDSAVVKCRQAEDTLTIKKNTLQDAKVLMIKAMICEHQKKIPGAIVLLSRYKAFADTMSVKPDEYDAVLVSLGVLFTKTGQFARADSLLRLEVKKIYGLRLEYAFVMQQALSGLCGNLIAEKKFTEASDSLFALCHLSFRAIDKNFYGMSEAEKLKYKNGLNEIFDMLYTCLYNEKIIDKRILSESLKLEQKRNNLVLLTQADWLKRIRNSADTGLSVLYITWLQSKEILSKQYSLPAGDRFYNTDSLENICEMVEKKLSALGKQEKMDGSSNTDASSRANTLPAGTASITFVRFLYKTIYERDSFLYAAFVVKNNDSFPLFVHVCSEHSLIKILKNNRGGWIDENQLTQKIYNSRNKTAEAFFKLLWKPLDYCLNDISEINYSTSGLLNNISFHALYDGRKYMMQKYQLHRFFNVTDEKNKFISYKKPAGASIWGNINYDTALYDAGEPYTAAGDGKNFSVLAKDIKTRMQTKEISKTALQSINTNESDLLRKIFLDRQVPVSFFGDKYATEENFKQSSGKIKGVLHISTHGFYVSLDRKKSNSSLPGNFMAGTVNPLFRCGLAFSGVNYYWLKGMARQNREDGVLTGYEVAQLDLHNVELLTLSACETGLGDVTGNEGNLGLQRAFKLAGVQNMLVSLWQVPAKQTAELLYLFYTNWLNGQTLSASLQHAEMIMQKKNYPPYFWAGFVLIE